MVAKVVAKEASAQPISAWPCIRDLNLPPKKRVPFFSMKKIMMPPLVLFIISMVALPIYRNVPNILQQHQARVQNHPHSERSKVPKQLVPPNPRLRAGDLVYLPFDHNKTQPRNRYLVVAIEKP